MNMPKNVVVASDHAGFALKEIVKKHLASKGITVMDTKPILEEEDDYPGIVREGCANVLREHCLGIVFGGSGNGEAMAANKVKGIRCAMCYSEETARLARAHNNANVMSLGGRFIDEQLAKKMVDIFLTTDFEGGRHQRRVDDLEAGG